MTKKLKNVPELRFPEFNEDWNERTISDSIKILKSGLSRELSTTDIGLPVIRANNLQNYNLVLDDIKYWFKEDPKGAKTENYYLEKNDILVNFINSEAKMGTSCIIKSDFKRDTIYTTNILRYVTKETYDSYFHYIYTQTYNYKKWIKIITKPAVNQASFTTVDFKKIPYYIPEFNEQKKIGDFFSKLDRQIELEEQKLSLLEEQKKGYMQKIFSQEIRFKDDNGNDYPEWESKKFLDIFKLAPSKNNQIKSSEVVENGIIPVVDQGKDIYLGYSNEKDKAIEDFDNVIVYGDHTTIIKYIKEPFIIGGDGVKLLESNDGSLIHYLYILLQYFNVKPEGYKRHYSILKNKMMNISNTKEEQEKIGDFFNEIDELIEKQSSKIGVLKQRKKGFLQKMFV